MTRYVVRTNGVDDRHDEFNAWYDDVHIPDILPVPGFVGARRFRLAVTEPTQSSERRYLAVYEIEADSAERAPSELAAAVERGTVSLDASLDRASVPSMSFEEIPPPRIA